MFYGDPLDIAFGRDVIRAHRGGNKEFLFRWETLFFAGVAAVLVLLAAYLRGRAPRIAIIILMTLLGTYLLHAAVFSQLVALHPYLFDVVLLTPLVLALFVTLPAIAEVRTGGTGLIVLIVLFAAAWTSLFQLRLYAMGYPAPQPAAVLAAPNGGRPRRRSPAGLRRHDEALKTAGAAARRDRVRGDRIRIDAAARIRHPDEPRRVPLRPGGEGGRIGSNGVGRAAVAVNHEPLVMQAGAAGDDRERGLRRRLDVLTDRLYGDDRRGAHSDRKQRAAVRAARVADDGAEDRRAGHGHVAR